MKEEDTSAEEAITSLAPATSVDIVKAVEGFNQAILNPSTDALGRLCADKLSYGHSSGLIQTKAEFIDDLVNGPFVFSELTSPELSVDISGDTAWARFIFLGKGKKDGEPVDVRIGCMQIYQRQEDGAWLLLARQAFKL